MLELGAGTGMVSMFCARYLQPEVVVATDRELGLMRQIRDCAGRNGLVGEKDNGGVFKGWIWEWGRELSRGSGEDDDVDDELQQVGDGEKVEFDVALGADLVRSSLLFPFRIFSSALLVCGYGLYTMDEQRATLARSTGCNRLIWSEFPEHYPFLWLW